MKSRRNLVSMSLMITVIFVVVSLVSNGQTAAATNQHTPPTPAPTATLGPPPPNPTSIPLAQPIGTKEQALEQTLYYDAILSTWAQPWSKDTLGLQPNRITIEEYPSRSAESAARGSDEWFAPEIEADAGGVWAITIKGDVHVAVLSPREGASTAVYDGVTYVISKRTGSLLTIRTGPPKK